MAYISFQPSDFFNTVLWAGNSSTQSVTGVGFQPDFTWGKNRSITASHLLYDSTRGAGYYLVSNATSAEAGSAGLGFDSFDSDGFTLDGTSGYLNNSGSNYVGWNWKANGGTTSSNTDGSITSTVQANTTSGFSIVTYTGNATVGATIGHGLGVAPKVVIIKNRTTANDWWMYNKNIGAGYYLELNNTQAAATTSGFNSTDPTSSVFSVYSFSVVNGSGDNMLAYCFAEIKGYSKFGSYTGNGSTDGTFIYTGFRPAFVMIKRTDAVEDWWIQDVKRNVYNPIDKQLYPNGSYAEATETSTDFLSNGFKLRSSNINWNASGGSYIYMAFAEFPVVGSNGTAGTAR